MTTRKAKLTQEEEAVLVELYPDPVKRARVRRSILEAAQALIENTGEDPSLDELPDFSGMDEGTLVIMS